MNVEKKLLAIGVLVQRAGAETCEHGEDVKKF